MRKSNLTFEQFEKLSDKEKQIQYENLSDHDKYLARINSPISCTVVRKSNLSKEELKKEAEKMKQDIEKDNPRWLHEIPGIKNNGKKRKLTKKEKKEAKEFRNAIKNDKINEWFNKDKPKKLDK